MLNKAEIKRQYKETKIPMGIYRVRNNVTGRYLIGWSLDIRARLNRFKFSLTTGIEPVKELQEDYNKYGESSFVFETLDVLEPKEEPQTSYVDDLKELEALWREKLADTAHLLYPEK